MLCVCVCVCDGEGAGRGVDMCKVCRPASILGNQSDQLLFQIFQCQVLVRFIHLYTLRQM